MAFMKFYVGNEANASSHRDGIYVAIDTKKIFYNGDAYGGSEVDLSNYATKADLNKYLPLTGGVLTGNLYVNGKDHSGSFGISLNSLSINVSTPLSMSSSDPYYHYLSQLNNHSLIIGSSTYDELVLDENGIKIRRKTSNDLLHAAGGTVSIQDIISQVSVPTKVSQLSNDSGYQTESQVSAKVSALVNSAPETLDTLKELADALGNDPNFATTITNQIAGKANVSHTHKISEITNLQSTLDGKAASSHTHPVSQITGLTASRALVSDSSGYPAVSAVTSTELGYLDGVTSNVQTQLNGKAASSHTHTVVNISNLGSNWATALTAAKPNWITSVNIATISDLNANWDALLKSDPSGYVTRWPNISEVGSKQNLVIKLNGGTTEGTNQFTYNVTAAKSINITPSSIGAAASSHTHTASQVSGLSTVATSGSYNDLTNKPTIPSAYTLPTASNSTKGGVKIGSGLTMSGEVLSVSLSNATTSSSGLMSSSDKSKLNGLPSSVEAMTSSEILKVLNA